MAEVVSGGSYFSQNSFTLYFGLGRSEKLDRIEVRWPRGTTQEWLGVAANRTVQLTEGSEKVGSHAWVKR